MKGQIRIEFIFGVVIFAIIIFLMVGQMNTIFTSVGTDSLSDTTKARGIGFLDMIVKDSGSPLTWESDPSSIVRFGLSYYNQPFNLSMAKIVALNISRNPENRCLLLEDQGLGGYRLTIYKNNVLILECGEQVVTPFLETISRPVFIEDEYGQISLEVWR